MGEEIEVEPWETTQIEQLRITPRYWSATGQNIPEKLRGTDQWICASWDKVPRQATGMPASVANPKHWTSYGEAIAALEDGQLCRLGFVFTTDDPYCGIDLDNCRDLNTGVIAPWALEIMEAMNSYTEVSISGTGLHIIVEAALSDGRGRRFDAAKLRKFGHEVDDEGRLELYSQGRYFILTGVRVPKQGTQIHKCQPQINAIISRLGA